MHISVIICTHNPREEFLRRTLESLKKQTLPQEQWELLLVDNASKESLTEKWDLSWHQYGRHVHEEALGLTPARLRGIESAQGELIVFFDDDNLPCINYLARVLEIARDFPILGVWGAGELIPEYEVEPHSDLLPYVRFLALRTIEKDIWKNQPSEGPLPWGAGLVVRRNVAHRYVATIRQCRIRSRLDRIGKILMSGGDDEFSWVAATMGYGYGLFKDLSLIHLIPEARIQNDYLKRMLYGNGFSCAVLAAIHQESLGNPYGVPQVRNLFGLLFRLRIASLIHQSLRWLNYYRKNRTARTIEKARSDGWDEGLKWLLELNNGQELQLNEATVARMIGG